MELAETGLEIARVGRGLCQLAMPLYRASRRHGRHRKAPEGVVYLLLSALAFHDLTIYIPHEIYLAIRHRTRPPRLDYPPIRGIHFSYKALSAGSRGMEASRWCSVPCCEHDAAPDEAEVVCQNGDAVGGGRRSSVIICRARGER